MRRHYASTVSHGGQEVMRMLRTVAIVTLGVVLFACAGSTDQRPAPTVGGFQSSPSPLPQPTEVHPFYRPGGKEDAP